MDKSVDERDITIEKENWDKIRTSIIQSKQLQLGSYYTHAVSSDLKHLVFALSRYKFASKLLMYKKDIRLLELGCQEAIGALMFQQNIKLEKYVGLDFDERAMDWNRNNLSEDFEFICGDLFHSTPQDESFDAVVSLDVIEHISTEMERKYCEVICSNIKQEGTVIIGTPNIKMDPYACEASKIGHINLYSQDRLYHLMEQYFHNVFIFNMNDEVVHTGFNPMACYIFAVCCNKKQM